MLLGLKLFGLAVVKPCKRLKRLRAPLIAGRSGEAAARRPPRLADADAGAVRDARPHELLGSRLVRAQVPDAPIWNAADWPRHVRPVLHRGIDHLPRRVRRPRRLRRALYRAPPPG